ncbi:sensor histidine kinase [Geodermatophilus sp. SYSU D00742]
MRTRIIGLAVWVSVLAIGLFGVPLAVAVLQYAEQAERGELQRIADAVSIAVADDLDRHEPVGDLDGHGVVELTVYDAGGNWVGGNRREGNEAEVGRALRGGVSTGTNGDHVVVVAPVTHSNDVIGAVRAMSIHDAVLPRVLMVWTGMAALAALAVTTAWLVGRRQARRLAHPLEDLAVAAHRLGDGDFSVRIRRGGVPEIDAVGSALDATAVRLDDLLARERALSAEVSHQLRTPLAGLRLRLEAALERPDQDPRPAIAASLTDADRLEGTIDEILALARDRRPSPSGPLDLSALLSELTQEWRAHLALRGRTLDLTVEPGTPAPRASSTAVRQVLAVLLDNATTHGAGTVSLTVREAAGAVAVAVSDEGQGVPKSGGDVFSRSTERRDGHGMGLALARRLAEAEHGRLVLTQTSPPVFKLLLPSVPEETPHGQRPAVGLAGATG